MIGCSSSTDGRPNLRILDVEEIKTVPCAPLSHPFVERLIGTIRRECLDRTLFCTAADLEAKFLEFQCYYNGHRAHGGLNGRPPESTADQDQSRASLHFVPLQAALSRTLSDADRGVRCRPDFVFRVKLRGAAHALEFAMDRVIRVLSQLIAFYGRSDQLSALASRVTVPSLA